MKDTFTIEEIVTLSHELGDVVLGGLIVEAKYGEKAIFQRARFAEDLRWLKSLRAWS